MILRSLINTPHSQKEASNRSSRGGLFFFFGKLKSLLGFIHMKKKSKVTKIGIGKVEEGSLAVLVFICTYI